MRCDTTIPINLVTVQQNTGSVIPETAFSHLPELKQNEINLFVKKLVRSSPKMKPERIMRKVSEKFKVDFK